MAVQSVQTWNSDKRTEVVCSGGPNSAASFAMHGAHTQSQAEK
jgi:hypothetical protein